MSQVFYPWRNISDVSCIGDDVVEYVDKCIHNYINVNEYNKEEDTNDSHDTTERSKTNEQILSEYHPKMKTVNLGKERKDLNYKWDKHSSKVNREDIQTVGQYLRKDVNASMPLPTAIDNLNSDQLQFLTYLKHKTNQIINNENTSHIFCMLQGMPGTGKSHLLRACVQHISQTLGSESVKVIAPTGVAAKNVDGCTLHSFLLLGKFGFNMKSVTGPDLLTYRQKYDTIKFLFVEECSMVGLRMLACLEKRCREIFDSDSLFGSLNVILIGDVNQLLPIADQPLYADKEIATQHNNLLERGKLIMNELKSAFIFRKCHRFANDNYVKFLKRISTSRCTQNDVKMINERCITYLKQNDKANFKDSLRRSTTNESANEYNMQQLQKLNAQTAIIKANNNNQAAFASNDDMADGLVNDLYLCEGAKIMLKKNLNVSRGLVNGCVGILKYIIYEEG
ncbi:ATP-dependent DNA helicase [Frankliniella fusca]|uniref:ATP-dependent DNA helicase n=1 Tax=Frankliniella fusca TaxID=407009 RepID=A0AAE1HAT3_9NEOP|nr:ATP-dependent DNA helicase [Frankliniella fusca]